MKVVERLEDMSPTGRLRLLQQDDGDIIVAIIDDPIAFMNRHSAEQRAEKALEWAAQSEHHPACPIATGKGQRTITRDDCECHVKEAQAALMDLLETKPREAFPSVEFCAIFSGGGGSPRTIKALRNLLEAMEADNQDHSYAARRGEQFGPEPS